MTQESSSEFPKMIPRIPLNSGVAVVSNAVRRPGRRPTIGKRRLEQFREESEPQNGTARESPGRNNLNLKGLFGGAEEDRTPDL